MGYSNNNSNKPRLYFNVGKGVFNHKSNEGTQSATNIDGILTGLVLRQQTFNDGSVDFAEFRLEDEAMACIVPLDRSKGAFRSVINALARVDDLRGRHVEFRIWLDRTTGYNRISVNVDGNKVGWLYGIDEIPKPETFMHDGQAFSSTRKRDLFYKYLTDKVSAAIEGKTVQRPAEIPAPQNPGAELPAPTQGIPAQGGEAPARSAYSRPANHAASQPTMPEGPYYNDGDPGPEYPGTPVVDEEFNW